MKKPESSKKNGDSSAVGTSETKADDNTTASAADQSSPTDRDPPGEAVAARAEDNLATEAGAVEGKAAEVETAEAAARAAEIGVAEVEVAEAAVEAAEVEAAEVEAAEAAAEAAAAKTAEVEAAEAKDDATDAKLSNDGVEQAEAAAADSADGLPAKPDEIDGENADSSEPPPVDEPRRRPWFSLFNFLLILILVGAAIYYVWQQRELAAGQRLEISALQDEIAQRLETDSLAGRLQPLRGQLGELDSRLAKLGEGQQELRESSIKLFDLYGRNKNDWQLAEVEYLMRVAQHQLVLSHDFEGAATTLQAANDRLAGLADPGLLPVRVTISDEIAELKTRKRADLVGMTLILAQLSRQVSTLRPGFEPLLDPDVAPPAEAPAAGKPDWLQRLSRFVDSLVEVRFEPDRPPTLVEASVIDAGETLVDTLKLARWSVLERDARQYDRLITEAIRLTRAFYDLDNAANLDFLNQLLELQKMQLNPEKPDITGSMLQLQQIISQRKNAPTEAADG